MGKSDKEMAVKAVLFDFDFTLADPSAWLLPAWVEALDAIGERQADPAILKGVVGRPLAAQYARIVGEAPSGGRFETFERCYSAYRDRHAATQTAILDGVTGALGVLHHAGFVLGIISTGAIHRIRAILSHARLDRFFRVVKGGSEDKAPVILSVTDALGVDPGSAVYVGDHPEDCRAAVQARVGFIAVTTGAHTESDFPEGTVVLASVADLPGWILPTP
jgi:phosphoglycolate phosphatase-like HAD superfamily hydrolase